MRQIPPQVRGKLDHINPYAKERKLFSVPGELFFDRKGNFLGALESQGEVYMLHKQNSESKQLFKSRLSAIAELERGL